MNITPYRTETILNSLVEKHDLEGCTHYGEKGYQDPEVGVLFANWNDISGTISDYLEEAGYDLEWYDEWMIDYENDKCYRTSPDSYGWVCAVKLSQDGDWITPDSPIEDWIYECEVTDKEQPTSALPDYFTNEQLECEGYAKQNADSYEAGMHYGQNDNPQEIVEKLLDVGLESVLFIIDRSRQFDTSFSVYAK